MSTEVSQLSESVARALSTEQTSGEQPPNTALRKQKQNKTQSHFEATTKLFRDWAGSTGSHGSEEPMLDAGVNSGLVNSLPFVTTGFWRTFALSLQNPWVRWFGGKVQLGQERKKDTFSSCFMQLLSQPFFLLCKVRHRFTKLPSAQSWAIHFKAGTHFQGLNLINKQLTSIKFFGNAVFPTKFLPRWCSASPTMKEGGSNKLHFPFQIQIHTASWYLYLLRKLMSYSNILEKLNNFCRHRCKFRTSGHLHSTGSCYYWPTYKYYCAQCH